MSTARWVVIAGTVVLSLGAPSERARATERHVPTTEFPDIQAAIDVSGDRDIVTVDDNPSGYSGVGFRDIEFRGYAITVRSFSDDPTQCLILCGGTSQEAHRGFWFHSAETNGAVLRGFTIRQGRINDPQDPGGGAILCEGASPTIFNCIIESNYSASQGGAIACLNGSAPVISHCTLSSNAVQGGAIQNRKGGAIYCDGSSPIIKHCTITGSSGALLGGAIYSKNGQMLLLHTILSGNHAQGNSTYGAGGGAIYTLNAALLMRNCLVDHNYAVGGAASGDGVYCSESIANLHNCTLADNGVSGRSGGGGFVYSLGAATPKMTNCIIWGNYSFQISSYPDPAVTHSDVQDAGGAVVVR